jgi:hypothetical protein
VKVSARRRLVRLVAAAVICTVFASAPATPATAVSYPIESTPGSQYPYVVSIYHNEEPGKFAPAFSCTGSLIDRYYVLTAAHCVDMDGLRPDQILVAHGGDTRSAMSYYGVITFKMHPRFTIANSSDDIGLPNDIALLHLAEPIDGPYLQLTAKGDAAARAGKRGMRFYGWGQDQNGRISENLAVTRQVDMSSTARKWFGKFNPSTQIAAGYKIRGERLYSGPCYGDSGGPLVGFAPSGEPRLLGVVSYGASSCRTASPVVYTRVSPYLGWIKSAKADLAAEAADSTLVYMTEDSYNDASGAWSAAEISSVVVVSNRTNTLFLAEMLIENWSMFSYTMEVSIASYFDVPLMSLTASGLIAADGSTRCPASYKYLPQTAEYPYHTISVNTDCLVANVGTTFDAQVTLTATDSISSLPSVSTDSSLVEFVVVPSL